MQEDKEIEEVFERACEVCPDLKKSHISEEDRIDIVYSYLTQEFINLECSLSLLDYIQAKT